MNRAKIGMRTIKTVFAVILTLIIANIVGLNSPILAGVAAIMIMESFVSESFVTGKNRMFGTILGGLIGLIASYIAPGNYLLIAVGLIIIISICNFFGWEKAVRMAMVVFLVIVTGYGEGNQFNYAFNRTLDTLVGVIVGTAINFFIRPPRTEENIIQRINLIYIKTRSILKELIWTGNFEDFDYLKNEFTALEEKYKILLEDMRYHIGKKGNTNKYRNVFNSFEIIQNHLAVLNEIKKATNINEENRRFLKEYFGKEVPAGETSDNDELDLIYNYHLNIIFINIQIILDFVSKYES
ncbi:MAG TPA: hypothetical protein GXZ90_02700 [Clostridiales bacterium]|nr:hypothetical protein [Clostridiales bacterium]